jgi:hypothetical protein
MPLFWVLSVGFSLSLVNGIIDLFIGFPSDLSYHCYMWSECFYNNMFQKKK